MFGPKMALHSIWDQAGNFKTPYEPGVPFITNGHGLLVVRYWMPDVFDDFFARFNRKPADYYELERLDPAYRIFLDNGRPLDIPDSVSDLEDLFDRLEPGSRTNFRKFMEQAE